MRIDPKSRHFTLILGLLAALPALSIDISAPSLADLPAQLQTSATMAGMTVSLFMAGFAIGLGVGGFWSDRVGRRPVLLASLACFTLAAAGCTAAQSGIQLLVCRALQGFGAGSCYVLAMAIIQDLFSGEAARKKRSYVTVIFGITPVLAPILGAWLLDVSGWRAANAALFVAGLALLAITATATSESHLPQHRLSGRAGLQQFAGILSDRRLLGIACVNAVSYGGLFAYIAGSPLVVIGSMGLSPNMYAGIFGLTACSLTAGAYASGRLGRTSAGLVRLLDAGMIGSTTACLAAVSIAVWPSPPAALYLPALMVFFFCRGLVAPNLQHAALERRQKDAGTTAAAIGLVQLAVGALTSAIVAALVPSLRETAIIGTVTICSVLAGGLWFLGLRAVHVISGPDTAPASE